MLEMLLTLSSILATSSSDSTWLVIKAKLKRSCSVGCKTFVWQVISYHVFNLLTLVSVSMPLSNTLFWILNACLKKKRYMVNFANQTVDDNFNHHCDHEHCNCWHYNWKYLIFPLNVNCLITFSASEATSSIIRTHFSFEYIIGIWHIRYVVKVFD